eukprot:6395565-Ditylum_brightwellii.AAC.1
MKRILARKEREEKEKAQERAVLRKEQDLFHEYQKIVRIIKEGDVNAFTFQDFVVLGNKFTSTYYTDVDERRINVEPKIDGKKSRIHVPGCAVRSSLKDVLSRVKSTKT